MTEIEASYLHFDAFLENETNKNITKESTNFIVEAKVKGFVFEGRMKRKH